MSIGRQEAFEIFKRDYFDNAAIEDKKKQLKKNYNEAKTLGETINNSRNNISSYFPLLLLLLSGFVSLKTNKSSIILNCWTFPIFWLQIALFDVE